MLVETYKDNKWIKRECNLEPTVTIPVKECQNHRRMVTQIDIVSEDGRVGRFFVQVKMEHGRPKAFLTAKLTSGETEKSVTGVLKHCAVSTTPIEE